jgi:hypothetical protein
MQINEGGSKRLAAQFDIGLPTNSTSNLSGGGRGGYEVRRTGNRPATRSLWPKQPPFPNKFNSRKKLLPIPYF